MVSFSSLLLVCSTVIGALAAPTEVLEAGVSANATDTLEKRSYSSGTNGGYWYQFWTASDGGVTYSNGNGGQYTVKWTNTPNFTAGKGWNPGSARNINFSSSFSASGNAHLSVYGWTTNPLIEYYIIENWADATPGSGATYKGTVTSDGATYRIYQATRVNQPSIIGTATFQQFISVRSAKRASGTVTTANHFNAWSGLGMKLGTHNYQIVSTEGISGSGSATVTVS